MTNSVPPLPPTPPIPDEEFEYLERAAKRLPAQVNLPPLIYIAGPYASSDPEIRAFRTRFHTRVWAQLTQTFYDKHLRFYSPIAYGASIFQLLPIRLQHDHNYWMGVDLPILQTAQYLLILKLPGWESSPGLMDEITFAIQNDISIIFANITETDLEQEAFSAHDLTDFRNSLLESCDLLPSSTPVLTSSPEELVEGIRHLKTTLIKDRNELELFFEKECPSVDDLDLFTYTPTKERLN